MKSKSADRVLKFFSIKLFPGLCCSSAWGPQATNSCLQVNGKTYFLHIALTPDFIVESFRHSVLLVRAQSWVPLRPLN